MSLLNNLIFSTDAYKFSHYKQYPPNTTAMFSYLESRGGQFDETVFFGLQYILKEFFSTPITVDDVEEAQKLTEAMGVPFNYEGWMYIAKDLNGKLPIRIKAVPEGTVVPTKHCLMTVESTDPKVFWIVSFLETMLMRLWYPTTVATLSKKTKNIIAKYLQETSDDVEAEIAFKLNDFGARGTSSKESAMIGGAAHLVNFSGSDTVEGILMAHLYYNFDIEYASIPASEHSTMTMWGRENEAKAYENMLEQYKDQPIFACVSDSYNIYNATSELWGSQLKQKVKDFNGTVVLRPDSGNPIKVVCDMLRLLEESFGATINSKGYKVINDNVRIIQGDGIDIRQLEDILINLQLNGYSATNIAFGMGGGLLQKVNRDTQKFAFKCSWAKVDGKDVDVFKSPIDDVGKVSKKGRLDLSLEEVDGSMEFLTVQEGMAKNSILQTVYENGELLIETNFNDVRSRSNEDLA